MLVDREIDRLLNEEARNFPEGIAGLENYLKSLDKTMDGHREELHLIADRRVVRSLVLEKIAEAEKIEVDTSEIDEEIDKMVKDAGEKAEEIRNLFGLPQARESIKQSLITRKTVDRLVQIASGSV
jgi:trigger factor